MEEVGASITFPDWSGLWNNKTWRINSNRSKILNFRLFYQNKDKSDSISENEHKMSLVAGS